MNEELISIYENINRYYPGTIEATPAEFANSFNNDPEGFRAFLDIAQSEYPKAFDHYVPSPQVIDKNSGSLLLGVDRTQGTGPVKPVRRTKDDIFEAAYPIPVDQINTIREQFKASETEVRARSIPINVKLNTVLQGGDMFPWEAERKVQEAESIDPRAFLSKSERVEIDKQAGIEALSYFPLSSYTPAQISKAFNASKSESDLAGIDLAQKSEDGLGEERAPQRFTTFSSSVPGKAITYRGERFKITRPEKLAVSHDDAAVNIEHLLATSPMTTQDIMETDHIDGYGDEELLRMKDFLSFDDKLRAEKEIHDLSLYQRIAEKKLARIEEPVKQAYDQLATMYQAVQQGAPSTPEMEQQAQQLGQFLQTKTDQVQEYEDALNALDSARSQYQAMGEKYPDLKLADQLNRKIQEKTDLEASAELDMGMKLGRMLFFGPADPLVEPIGRPVLEAIPKLFGRLASTAEGEMAGNGSQEAAVKILRRSRARMPAGTFRDPSVAQRPLFERVSDFEFDGERYTLGLDGSGIPTQIYDETGNIAQLDPSLKESLMVEAIKNPAVRSGVKEKLNSSALFNTLQDVSADLIGTFTLAYMTQGLGTATSIERAREFAAVMLQYEGSFIEEGLKEGLSLDEAVVYGRFKSIQEGGWEAAFPFISRVTDGKVLTGTKDALKRIISEGNTKAMRSLAYKETRKNVLGMVQEGGEEFGVNLTDPFINQAFNNFYETDLDTEFSSFKDMATDFAIGAAVSIIPGAIGSVNSRRKVLGSQSLQESVFHGVTNLADVKRVAGNFKLEELKNVIPALEATKTIVEPILKHGNFSDAQKLRITSAVFDAQVAAMDRMQLAGTANEKAAEKAAEDADALAEKIIKEKYTPEGIKTPEEGSIIPEGVQNPLQNVESTAKAIRENSKAQPKEKLLAFAGKAEDRVQAVAEMYHKAKADGSNPELVKATEDLLGQQVGKNVQEGTISTERKDKLQRKDIDEQIRAIEDRIFNAPRNEDYKKQVKTEQIAADEIAKLEKMKPPVNIPENIQGVETAIRGALDDPNNDKYPSLAESPMNHTIDPRFGQEWNTGNFSKAELEKLREIALSREDASILTDAVTYLRELNPELRGLGGNPFDIVGGVASGLHINDIRFFLKNGNNQDRLAAKAKKTYVYRGGSDFRVGYVLSPETAQRIIDNNPYNKDNNSESAETTEKITPQENLSQEVDVNLPLETQIKNINEGTSVLQRFSPAEQSGLTDGGSDHVAASLIVGRGNIPGEEQDTRADRQEGDVEKYARERKIWYPNALNKLKKLYGKPFAKGNESSVFYDEKRGVVIKNSNIEQYRDLQDALDGITAHNTVFPESKQVVVGFGLGPDGEFQIITEQPFVKEGRRKSTENKATQKEIDAFMEALGFEKDDSLGLPGRYKRDDIIANDITPKNVIRTPGGRIVPIDTIMHLNTEVWGGTRPEIMSGQNAAQTTENVSPIPESGEPIDAINRQQTENTATNTTTASIPVMITRKMEADLRNLGYTQAQIDKLTPQEANDILQASNLPQTNDTQNQEGVPGEIQVGQEPVETQPNQEAGQRTIAGGGVLETRQAPLVAKEVALQDVRQMAMNSTTVPDAEMVYNANKDLYDTAGVTVTDIQSEITKAKSPNWADDISRQVDTGEGVPPELPSSPNTTPLAVPEFTGVEREAMRMLKEWSVFRSADPKDVNVMEAYERMVSRGQITDSEEERNKYEQAVMKIAATQESMADLLNQIEAMFALDGKTRDEFERFLIQAVSNDSTLDIRAKQAVLNAALNGMVSSALKPLVQRLTADLASAVSGTMSLMRIASQDSWISQRDSDFIRSGIVNPKGPSGSELTETEEAIDEADQELSVSDRALEISESTTTEELIALIAEYNKSLEEVETEEQTETPNPDKKGAKELAAVLETGMKGLYGENHQEKLKEDIDNAEKRCL